VIGQGKNTLVNNAYLVIEVALVITFIAIILSYLELV